MTTEQPGEPVWEPDDTVEHEVGTAEPAGEPERPVAVLWVPDPEQRHGWREYYVKKGITKPNDKRMGFRKR